MYGVYYGIAIFFFIVIISGLMFRRYRRRSRRNNNRMNNCVVQVGPAIRTSQPQVIYAQSPIQAYQQQIHAHGQVVMAGPAVVVSVNPKSPEKPTYQAAYPTLQETVAGGTSDNLAASAPPPNS
jgi:hypothetical protein